MFLLDRYNPLDQLDQSVLLDPFGLLHQTYRSFLCSLWVRWDRLLRLVQLHPLDR